MLQRRVWNRGMSDEANFWPPVVASVGEEGGEEGQREEEVHGWLPQVRSEARLNSNEQFGEKVERYLRFSGARSLELFEQSGNGKSTVEVNSNPATWEKQSKIEVT